LARKADHSKCQELHVQLLGISADNPFSQQTLAALHGLPYPLLSALYMKTIKDYGTVYGATGAKVDYPGLEGKGAGRTFFLVDKEGIVRGKWVGEDMAVFPNKPLLKVARELSGG
jgi:glutaredoxin-dependent peroxiredoxin